MPLTQAAQAVQVSALPTAYAKWTDDALHLVEQLTSTLTDCANDAPAALPNGFALPTDTPPAVTTAISWALNQLGTRTTSADHAPTRTPTTQPGNATARRSCSRRTGRPASPSPASLPTRSRPGNP